MKVDELLNILKFQHDVALKCNSKFSTFKYYSRIHQTYSGKVGLKLNLTYHFQTYLLSIFIVPNFSKFCNHFIINSKKGPIFLLCYFKLFSIYFLLLLSIIGPFFDCFGDDYIFWILYHAFTYVYWIALVMFTPMMWELLYVEIFCYWKSTKSKLKIWEKWVCSWYFLKALWWMGFYGSDFIIFRSTV